MIEVITHVLRPVENTGDVRIVIPKKHVRTMNYQLFRDRWMTLYSQHERLGQAFVNRFISKPWPELYHERDMFKAQKIILDWLEAHQYATTDELVVVNPQIV